MDAVRFDGLARRLATRRSRRGVTRLCAGLALGALAAVPRSDPAAAADLLLGGAACTSNGECQSGKCLRDDTCSCSKTVACQQPANSCKKASCDVKTRRCVITTKPKGSRCAHDGNLCTKDECNEKGKCKHPPKKDGTSCGAYGTCKDGICHSGY